MDSHSVIMKLETICNADYYRTASLNELYIDINNLYDYIQNNISKELCESLHTEMKSVYYEIRLGDGDSYDIVFNDCIEVLKKVIEELQCN